jgi:hypothetical protein
MHSKRSRLRQSLALAFGAWLLAACGEQRIGSAPTPTAVPPTPVATAMPAPTATSTPMPTSPPTATSPPTVTLAPTYTATPAATPTPEATPLPSATLTPTSTPTPEATPLPSATLAPTSTPTPLDTPTATARPSATFTPTPRPEPVQVPVAGCEQVTLQPGHPAWAEGYLALLEGTYSRNASQYTIWLEETQLSRTRLRIWIPGGDKPNSMHFEGRKPRIRDQQGAIIPWMTQGGYEVYCTQRLLTVEGTWRGDCTLEIETIR